MILDHELARLYARALIAIARADGVINFEEGLRLEQRIAARCGTEATVADLLLEPPLDPDVLADALRGGPFRGASVSPVELAEHLVADGVAVVLAKGHVSAGEATRLRAFAAALGVSDADFQRLTARVARWIPP